MMPSRRIILAIAFLAVLAVGLILTERFLIPEYFLFTHRSARYYKDFATACDALLAQHPIGTNAFIELRANDIPVPHAIRDLHPVKIKLSPNQVWMLHSGAIEFGITWGQERETRTNIWVLSTTCESDTKVLYARPNGHQ